MRMENKTKFCMALSPTFNLSEKEQLEKFALHELDGFFAIYKDYEQVANLKELALKKGLFFQSIHAKHHPMRELWFDGDNTDYIVNDLKECIVSASAVGVDRVVMHLYTGFDNGKPTTAGIKRVGELLELAQRKGVYICFENLQCPIFLDEVLTEYRDCEYARMCYDTGHENCYHTHAVVDKHKDKISALHINDNMGLRSKDKTFTTKDDLHLLPFDGNVDFDRVVNIIKSVNMQNELTFEFKFSNDSLIDKYKAISFDEYLSLAKSRMQKLAKMF